MNRRLFLATLAATAAGTLLPSMPDHTEELQRALNAAARDGRSVEVKGRIRVSNTLVLGNTFLVGP